MTNNNPLNIRTSNDKFVGEIPSSNDFKAFESNYYGYRAAFKIINTYIKKYGLNTVEEIINRWAPPIENNTEAYINFVCNKTGYDRDTVFVENDPGIIKLVWAMAWIEQGKNQGYYDIEGVFDDLADTD
jgi:hypothetical protein